MPLSGCVARLLRSSSNGRIELSKRCTVSRVYVFRSIRPAFGSRKDIPELQTARAGHVYMQGDECSEPHREAVPYVCPLQ